MDLFKAPELTVFVRALKTIATALPAYEYSKILRRAPNEYFLEFELCTTQKASFSNTHTSYSHPPLKTKSGSLEVSVDYRTRLEALSELIDINIDVEQSYKLPDKVVEVKSHSIIQDFYGDMKPDRPAPEKTGFESPASSEEPSVELPDISKLTIKEIASSVEDSEIINSFAVEPSPLVHNDVLPPVPISPLEALFMRGVPKLKQFQFDDSVCFFFFSVL